MDRGLGRAGAVEVDVVEDLGGEGLLARPDRLGDRIGEVEVDDLGPGLRLGGLEGGERRSRPRLLRAWRSRGRSRPGRRCGCRQGPPGGRRSRGRWSRSWRRHGRPAPGRRSAPARSGAHPPPSGRAGTARAREGGSPSPQVAAMTRRFLAWATCASVASATSMSVTLKPWRRAVPASLAATPSELPLSVA